MAVPRSWLRLGRVLGRYAFDPPAQCRQGHPNLFDALEGEVCWLCAAERVTHRSVIADGFQLTPAETAAVHGAVREWGWPPAMRLPAGSLKNFEDPSVLWILWLRWAAAYQADVSLLPPPSGAGLWQARVRAQGLIASARADRPSNAWATAWARHPVILTASVSLTLLDEASL